MYAVKFDSLSVIILRPTKIMRLSQHKKTGVDYQYNKMKNDKVIESIKTDKYC